MAGFAEKQNLETGKRVKGRFGRITRSFAWRHSAAFKSVHARLFLIRKKVALRKASETRSSSFGFSLFVLCLFVVDKGAAAARTLRKRSFGIHP